MELKTFKHDVLSRINEGIGVSMHPSNIAYCSCTRKKEVPGLFIVFQVVGQDHHHIQCFDCSTSYCPKGGDCAEGK